MDDEQPFEYVNRHKLDREVIGLALALNSFEGIHTFESCCGHGRGPFWIVFRAESFESLTHVLWWFRQGNELHQYRKWYVTATTDQSMDVVYYRLSGPSGEKGYEEANTLASLILDRVPNGHKAWLNPLWAQLKESLE